MGSMQCPEQDEETDTIQSVAADRRRVSVPHPGVEEAGEAEGSVRTALAADSATTVYRGTRQHHQGSYLINSRNN